MHSAPIARAMLTATRGVDTGTQSHKICNTIRKTQGNVNASIKEVNAGD